MDEEESVALTYVDRFFALLGMAVKSSELQPWKISAAEVTPPVCK